MMDAQQVFQNFSIKPTFIMADQQGHCSKLFYFFYPVHTNKTYKTAGFLIKAQPVFIFES
jgi:hypothetical protein